MIVLQQLSGHERGRRVEFVDAPVLLGRAPEADLRFDPHADIDVSARHAVLERDGERWVLRDLGSRNGTFVGGRRIRARPLSDRDEIELGHGGPRLFVTLVSAEASHLEHADTEPERSLFEAPPSRPDSLPEDEATRAISHEAETVAHSFSAPTLAVAPEPPRRAAQEPATQRERPSALRMEPSFDAERARLEASLRRTRRGLAFALLLVALLVAALLALTFGR